MKSKDLFNFFNPKNNYNICLAPMAEVNDLAFRLLCRKNNINICWTGLIDSHLWMIDKINRNKNFQTNENDHPLVCQIFGSDEQELINCAKDLEIFCEMIDLNCGCTHEFAKRKESGYFMINTQEKRKKTLEIINKLSKNLLIPISVKFRIIEKIDGTSDNEETIKFACDLEQNGANLIILHARKKSLDKKGFVDYNIIKEIQKLIKIPIIPNGGISNLNDIKILNEKIKFIGIMIGQALLFNPLLFNNNINQTPKNISLEYLNFAIETNEPIYIIKKHLYKFFEIKIKENNEISILIKNCKNIEEIYNFLNNY